MEYKYIYDEDFYERKKKLNMTVAENMIPYLISTLGLKSVVDFGCGEGIFVSEAKKLGCEVLGLDGDYINPERLLVSKNEFRAVNLEKKITLEKRYDLVLSLEVAEHLDEEYADNYIDSLTDAGDIIAFSAAIPYQGGTNHVNEQWPSYWLKKFENRGFYWSDCLRKKFWNNDDIVALRRQNILLIIKREIYNDVIGAFRELDEDNKDLIDYVHPAFYLEKINSIHKKQQIIDKMTCDNHFLNDMVRLLVKDKFYKDDKQMNELIGKLPFWNLIEKDKFDNEILGLLAENDMFMESFTIANGCKRNSPIVIWGMGKDGQEIFRVFSILNLNIKYCVDIKCQDKSLMGMGVISPDKFFEIYENEVIVIGSRKYEDSIREQIRQHLEKYTIWGDTDKKSNCKN